MHCDCSSWFTNTYQQSLSHSDTPLTQNLQMSHDFDCNSTFCKVDCRQGPQHTRTVLLMLQRTAGRNLILALCMSFALHKSLTKRYSYVSPICIACEVPGIHMQQTAGTSSLPYFLHIRYHQIRSNLNHPNPRYQRLPNQITYITLNCEAYYRYVVHEIASPWSERASQAEAQTTPTSKPRS